MTFLSETSISESPHATAPPMSCLATMIRSREIRGPPCRYDGARRCVHGHARSSCATAAAAGTAGMPSSSGNGTEAHDDAHDGPAADGSGSAGAAKQARRDAASGAGASAGGGGGKGITVKRPGDNIVRCSVPFGPRRFLVNGPSARGLDLSSVNCTPCQCLNASLRGAGRQRPVFSCVAMHTWRAVIKSKTVLYSMDETVGRNAQSTRMTLTKPELDCSVICSPSACDHPAPTHHCLASAVGCRPAPAASRRHSQRASASSRAATR